MNALAILARMHDAYASAFTYRDTGTVTVTVAPHRPRSNALGRFRTEFERSSGRFVFEFIPPGWVIRAERARLVEVRMPVADSLTTLSLAIAGLTGVTWGTAHNVPRMLMPDEVEGRALWSAEEPRLVGREVLDGEPCFVIDLGSRWRHRQLFIDVGSFSMRRQLIPMVQDVRYAPELGAH